MDKIETSSESRVQVVGGKILLWIFFLLVIGSLGFTYWKIMIKRNYVIVAQVECDPYLEKCFTHVCNPDPNVDGECTGNLAEDVWYTKNISRMAYNIPNCDPNVDESCTALVCGDNETSCSYELCDDSNVPDGDTCNDPVEYTKNNPIEEDVAETNVDNSVTDENISAEESTGADTSSGDCDSSSANQACSIPVAPTAVVQ
jgi:hypothetical protein